jgi:hypothetical protein
VLRLVAIGTTVHASNGCARQFVILLRTGPSVPKDTQLYKDGSDLRQTFTRQNIFLICSKNISKVMKWFARAIILSFEIGLLLLDRISSCQGGESGYNRHVNIFLIRQILFSVKVM